MEDRCAWCRGPVRRRKGKPVGKHGKLSDDQLRILHAIHEKRGTSIRELARAVLRTADYASEGSAVEGIRHGWKRLGLKARSRAEQVRIANRNRRIPGSPGNADRAASKRFHRARKGGYRRCAGVKLSYPEKGRPCQRYALVDSDYCLAHDPDRRAEVVERLEDARAAIAPDVAEGAAA